MDFLTDDSIMHGGGGIQVTQGLIFTLLYLAVMCSLWYVYYIKFENRPGFAKNIIKENDSDSSFLAGGYKITVLLIIAIIAFFIFFVGWKKTGLITETTEQDKKDNACYNNTITGKGLWEQISHYSIVPISWLSAGFLASLVVSQTTVKDLQEATDRIDAGLNAANADPMRKTDTTPRTT